MIRKFRRSLRLKLILLLTAVASIAVMASCIGLFSYQWKQAYNALAAESYTQARMLANNSGPALLFEDAKAANETLESLHGEARVKLACLYDRSGGIVARYSVQGGHASCPALEKTRSVSYRATFQIRKPVMVGNEPVGTLFLDISLAELDNLVKRSILVCAVMALGATLLALMLSSVMERWISRPILQLTRVAINVSKTGDYTLRAKRMAQDEVGLLIDHFNQMLAHVEERDAQLRTSYDSLEQKVAERTRDLTNEIAERKLVERDLQTARQVAEHSSQAKSSFLANMSHELRTPLNAIIGYSEMLSEDALAAGDTEITGDLDKILASARHLRDLISDVLDISKIEAGKMNLLMEETSAHSLMRDVGATAEVLSKNNRNRLSMRWLAEDVEVQVDSLRLRQCLLNLVSNACKFTTDGEITLKFEQQWRQGALYAVWSVEDTGAGISEADQAKLFKSFSQVDSSSTRKHGGTGLGLAISQELCGLMGGSIGVHSVPGVGSTFSIFMPIPKPEEESHLSSLPKAA